MGLLGWSSLRQTRNLDSPLVNRGLCVILLFSSVVSTFASGLVAAQEKASQIYVVDYTKGENWQDGSMLSNQVGFDAHRDYLSQLFHRDVLIAEGKLDDDRLSDDILLLVRASSIATARDLAFNNPAVKNGVFAAKVRIWQLGLSSVRRQVRLVRTNVPISSFRVESLDPSAPIVLKVSEP